MCDYTRLGIYLLVFSLVFIARSTATFVLPQKVRFYINATLLHLLLLIAVLYGLAYSLTLRAIGRNDLSIWSCCRFYAWMVARATSLKVVVEGIEHLKSGPAVLIMNHQTALDVFLFSAFIPKCCTLTAKRSLKFVPILGWFGSSAGVIYVERRKGSSTVDTLKHFASGMRTTKQSVLIFPEGTRSNFEKPNLLPFKKGAFHLAVQAKVPIIPVVTMNYSNVVDIKNKRFNAGEIRIKVLPLIDTSKLTAADVDTFATTTREQMLYEHVKMGI